jgi:hypothetical protein
VPPPDVFELSFFCMFLVTFGVLAANFFVGLSVNLGIFVLEAVIALCWRSVFRWNQVLMLAGLQPSHPIASARLC